MTTNYAIIENGIVVNVAMADPEYADAQGWIAAQGAGIGWAWDGETFTAPPAPPEPVPQSVTMRQARLALLAAGKLSLVQPIIEAMAEPQRSAARIEWEFARSVDRTHDFTIALGHALGLSDAATDDLFRAAALL